MKAVLVLFDSLDRRLLPPYGAAWTDAPNFARLAGRTVTFEHCYAGSLPCLPARRELHTGRYNFLHRGGGPLEPSDASVPALLSRRGVHTHLVSDQPHYRRDGGATYHSRYDSWEFVRGPGAAREGGAGRRPCAVDAGLAFLDGGPAGGWFLQIETAAHREAPPAPEARDARVRCAERLARCDRALGRVLHAMDAHALWEDTLLVVAADHGGLARDAGGAEWGARPWYHELAHTPLFVHDPWLADRAGQRCASLVQTVDIPATLLDYFGLPHPPHMQGRPLREAVDATPQGPPERAVALFGAFGGHVNVTDGRHVYARAPVDARDGPLFAPPPLPNGDGGTCGPRERAGAEPGEGVGGTTGARPPRVAVETAPAVSPARSGSMLFDLVTDPLQERPAVNDAAELRMVRALVRALAESEAPPEQYQRLGLPGTPAEVTEEHLRAAPRSARWRAAPERDRAPGRDRDRAPGRERERDRGGTGADGGAGAGPSAPAPGGEALADPAAPAGPPRSGSQAAAAQDSASSV